MNFLKTYTIDYIEIYSPMAKALSYWHVHALGFVNTAFADSCRGDNISSYVLESGSIRLVITSAYPTNRGSENEITKFISKNYCGVKRIALQVESVSEVFAAAVSNGAIPIKFPTTQSDDSGVVEEASVKLYDDNEITFVNRANYRGVFIPGYKPGRQWKNTDAGYLMKVDHIASEVRVNEKSFWTEYLSRSIGTSFVQSIDRSEENKTGLLLNVSQSFDEKITFVIAEPDSHSAMSKVQQNIDTYGPGIHHLAFATDDIMSTVQALTSRDVDFVNFPDAYYDLLRSNPELEGIDIDLLKRNGIIVDKEDQTWLFQKFLKPISDRPFFLYEIVQRVNGYKGFALKNINVLKKAEELQVMKGTE